MMWLWLNPEDLSTAIPNPELDVRRRFLSSMQASYIDKRETLGTRENALCRIALPSLVPCSLPQIDIASYQTVRTEGRE